MDAHPSPRRAGAIVVTVIVVILAVIAIVVATPEPASAHSVSGPRPTNFRTTLRSVTPRIAGVEVRVVDLGNKIELTNRTPTDVSVLGYDGEPYLRVGPRGVYENLRSPATYLNRTLTATTPVPDIARRTTASTAPRWRQVSRGHTASWHDHRVHWMGTSLPPTVQRDPGAFHRVQARWTVPLRYGDRPVTVAGRLDWVPGPSGRPWLPVIVGFGVVGFAAAYRKRGTAAIFAVVALVGIDVAHTVTAEMARSGSQPAKTLEFLGDNFVSVIVWIAAGLTIMGLRRDNVVARYGLVLVGAMVALVGGVTDLSSLWKSQLATVGPNLLARAEVAAGLGLGIGIATGAVVGLRRWVPRPARREARDPGWVVRLVGELDDDAVAVVSSRLAADEVIPIALAGVAARAAPVRASFGGNALAFVVLAEDQIGSHVWSITAGARALRVQRGMPAPVQAELRTTFPVFLQLLAGTRTLEAALAAGRVDVSGDSALVAAVEPYLRADTPVARPVATV